MSARKPVYDVFLSYAQQDVAWAAEVERTFADAGLVAYNIAKTAPGEHVADTVWDALAESAALVALVSSTGSLSPNLSFEVGAAMAWSKPAYALYKGAPPEGLPRYVQNNGIFPASQLQHVVGLVRNSELALSDRERQVLVKTYDSLGTPVVGLLDEPSKVDQLTRRFNRASKSKISGERLLRELLRLRKSGNIRLSRHRM
ncbi:MAG TPA: toll/interleukin-1 receptor domain-containing protein [Humisphaera sp.]|jgi:hypothetical protein|nr:toll/interleukin-1 receptor domain-containing protein [Humisphaera sp.]